jgi:hypothetical protein
MVSEKDRQVVEDQTRALIANEIIDFIGKSREAGRSEHFLSGLSTAHAIAIGVFGGLLPQTSDEQQELLF